MSAWTVIEHIEVPSGGLAEIEFDSIPQTYTDLYVLASLRQSNNAIADGFGLKLNGSTSNFSQRRLFGSGSSPTSDTGTALLWQVANNATASTFSNSSIYLPNYTSSSAKSYSNDGVSENNGTEAYQAIVAGLWDDTSAITSLSIYATTGSIMQYSSATLYGVLKGSSGGVTVS